MKAPKIYKTIVEIKECTDGMLDWVDGEWVGSYKNTIPEWCHLENNKKEINNERY